MSDDNRGAEQQSVAQKMHGIWTQLTRTKSLATDLMKTNLRRCLTTFDVTLLSFGHMVGSGVYVLTPAVAKTSTGPAIVLAYFISGLASLLAAVCYAELGVRYPRAGSAYSYTYLAVGELWAFIVGWNVALENTIGVAAIARACSAYVDSLSDHVIVNETSKTVGEIQSAYVNQLDFLSLGIVIVFVIFLSFGVQITSGLNNVLSLVNMFAIAIIVCVGGYYADSYNWTNPDTGGFMPFGWPGVFAGAATCFFAYVGFDSIAASAEEANDPTKSIPLATMISMTLACVTYVSVGAVLTLMVSYKDIPFNSGIPDALENHGSKWAKTVVIIGALCGMATGIIGNLFAATRVVYAMADDGLLFSLCANVNERMKIPLGSMYIFGTLAAVMSFVFDVQVLAELISIGTLFAYLVVSASVIIIRYRPHTVLEGCLKMEPAAVLSPIEESGSSSSSEGIASDPGVRSPRRKSARLSQQLGLGKVLENIELPTTTELDVTGHLHDRFAKLGRWLECAPGRLVSCSVFFFTLSTFVLCGFLRLTSRFQGEWWTVMILTVLVLAMVTCLAVISMHRPSPKRVDFMVPVVPVFPAISIFINAWLMANFSFATYMRLIVWIFIGLFIYFGYGIRHSKLNIRSTTPTPYCASSRLRFPVRSFGSIDQDVKIGSL